VATSILHLPVGLVIFNETGVLIAGARVLFQLRLMDFLKSNEYWQYHSMSLTKSKQRIADHGEVFTPEWMVEAMLDKKYGITAEEIAYIESMIRPLKIQGSFLDD
jgi:hypothetical protein